MGKLKILLISNFIVWLLAVVYSFVPYTRVKAVPDGKIEVQCENAWTSVRNMYAFCVSSGRIAEIIFWALLASSLVTALIIVVKKGREQLIN